jgi:hypothetical protein
LEKLKINFKKMGRQRGVIKFTGQVGDLTFYQTRDGYFVREKGGVDGNRLKNDPNYARTRENNAEFGHAGNAGRVLRVALRSILANSSDRALTSRMVREMMKVVHADTTNPRGQRNVVSGDLTLLKGFEFNHQGSLYQAFQAPFDANMDRGGGVLTVNIPDFDPSKMVNAPEGATHFRLISAGAEIDFKSKTSVVNVSTSIEVALTPHTEPGILLSNAVTVSGTQPIFLAFGIEFLIYTNGIYYPLNSGQYNAVALVGVEGAA